MSEVIDIPAQSALLPEVTKAIAEAFENLREGVWSNEEKLVKAAPPDNQPKAWMADPFTMLDSVGMGYRQPPNALTYDTLRQVGEQDTYVAPIILTRIDQVAAFSRPQPNKYSVGFKIQPRYGDKKRLLTPSERQRCEEIQMTVLNTGREYNLGRDSFRNFIAKFVRDSLTYDQGCFETVRTRNGGVFSFNAVPSDTMRTATPKQMRGGPPSMRDSRSEIAYVQVLNGTNVEAFTIDEMAFAVRNPRSGVKTYGYGMPEIQTLMTTITSHLWAEEWNRKMFSQGSTIKGVLNVKGNINPVQFENFKRMWHSQVSGVQNAWKTPMLNSEEVQWMPLQLSNSEMGYQMWMEYLCFTPDTKVMTRDGEMRIDEVEPGDEVYTHLGRLRRVLNTQEKQYSGNLVNVKVGGSVIQTTPEHPFFVATRAAAKLAEPRWVNAKDIDPSTDYLVVPKETYKHDGKLQEIDVSSHVTSCEFVESDDMTVHVRSAKKYAHNNVKSLLRFIDLDADVAYVLGLYVAEGCASSKQVVFTFNASETALVEQVTMMFDRLGWNSTVYKAKESVLNVRVSGRLVAELFTSLCGDNAYGKQVPDVVMKSPLHIQQSFFSGYFAGDGSVPAFASGAVTATLVSVSEKLVSQLQTILLRSQVFAYRYDLPKEDGGRKYRLDINDTQCTRLASWLGGSKGIALTERLHDTRQLKSRLREDDVHFYVPIHETWTTEYEGPVYNFEVDEDNTYQVNRFATHNCKITCALFRIDPAEINFDLRGGAGQQPVFMSTNEAQQKASKDRGLQPLMHFMEDTLNRHIVWKIDPRFELVFVGLDAKTEEQNQQLRMQQVQNTHTLNEVRAMDDLPPVQYGDNVMNATYIGYKMQKEQAEMMAQQAQQQPAAGGQPQSGGQAGQPESPPPRFSQAPGDEEAHGADQLRQFAEPNASGAQPSNSSRNDGGGGDDESSGPSPGVLSVLHRDDWSSDFTHSITSEDLIKSELFDVISTD